MNHYGPSPVLNTLLLIFSIAGFLTCWMNALHARDWRFREPRWRFWLHLSLAIFSGACAIMAQRLIDDRIFVNRIWIGWAILALFLLVVWEYGHAVKQQVIYRMSAQSQRDTRPTWKKILT